MRMLPLSPQEDKIQQFTHPAPPSKDSGEPTYTKPRDLKAKGIKPRVQRTYWNSRKQNTLTAVPIAISDWVMEEEVPTSPITFLSYPTRRCFMEDWVQARVQINGVKLDASAWVVIWVEKVGRVFDDTVVTISTEQATVDADRSKSWYKEHRPLKKSDDIGSEKLSESGAKVLFETCQTDDNVSFVATSIRLPAPPDDAEEEDVEYYFRIRIGINGRIIEAKSPVIRAMRWWAAPSKNLKQPKTRAEVIEPLVDGEAYFGKCADLIKAAASTIYIANWSFYLDTILNKEPGMTGEVLSALLLDKAQKGVKIYILFGEKANGKLALHGMQSKMLQYKGAGDKLDEANYDVLFEALQHPNIHVKIHEHPLKISDRNLGSYHEKYLVADEKEAALGGIDFQPNRYQDQTHSWTSDWHSFHEWAAWRKRYVADGGRYLYSDLGAAHWPESGESFRWHDAAVYVKGDVVQNIVHDFVRRWNDAGKDLGQSDPPDPNFTPVNRLNQPALLQTPDPGPKIPVKHNVQVVKTGDPGAGSRFADCKQQGTFDAYKQAIRQARHYIYIENQYFTWPALGDELCAALEKNPGLQLMVIVPFRTEEAAKLGNTSYEEQSIWQALKQLITDSADLSSTLHSRGVMHQQWQQAQLINRLRNVADAENRVGVFVLAAQMKDQAAPRPSDWTFYYDDGSSPGFEVIWRLMVDDVQVDQGVTGRDFKADFTIPAHARKVRLEGWDLPAADHSEKLDLSHKGSQEEIVVKDQLGTPQLQGIWAITASGKESYTGRTNRTGVINYTLSADATEAKLKLCWWQTVALDVTQQGQQVESVIHAHDGQPLNQGLWQLWVDDVLEDAGHTGPDGKAVFPLPNRAMHSAILYYWDHTHFDREHDLDLSHCGAPETFTVRHDPNDPTSAPVDSACWFLEVKKRKVVAGGATGADSKAKYTLPADTYDADLDVWHPCNPTWSTPFAAGASEIYPHSKLMIVDDTWAIVGSANANGRSFVTDEEINVAIHDRDAVTKLRQSLWKEHLGQDIQTRDIRTFYKIWKTLSLPPVDNASDCDPAKLASVHAIKLGKPPEGQEYNGPLSSLIDMGKMV